MGNTNTQGFQVLFHAVPQGFPTGRESNGSGEEKMRRRHCRNGDGEFNLETFSPTEVKMQHFDQVGYFGTNLDWKSTTPVHRQPRNAQIRDNGIGDFAWPPRTPGEVLR